MRSVLPSTGSKLLLILLGVGFLAAIIAALNKESSTSTFSVTSGRMEPVDIVLLSESLDSDSIRTASDVVVQLNKKSVSNSDVKPDNLKCS